MLNKEQFSKRQPRMIGEEKFRKYAVLIPLIEISGVTYLLFEKRSDKLRRQPGEICFPGGKHEQGETLQDCAVRETVEELQVLPQQIEILGPGDIYISPFNLMIHSFLGIIKDYQNTYSTDEVEKIIKVPLEFFRNHKPERYESKLVHQLPEDFPYERIQGGRKYPWSQGSHDILFYQYEDFIIWGMTAQITKSAIELLEKYNLKYSWR